ncbi:baculoviral IAP repeat-containing protein 7 isoform X2 [Rhinolophus ferrumequinum]|uniref:baculoviral IAP repeat-containing protein 7 isoform X2 n=1 Tax=Rhinolophus ferrumequinum TaxID=59479 RepID=UPI00140FDB8B|nr:baculoviral IAP repeat-containing protein 7 isoform X2 [Rhinolophus ferrumequinum]
MEPKDTTQCWGWGPELSRWAARGSPTRGHCVPHAPCGHVLGRGNATVPSWGGRGYMDGQLLGQRQPLMEEEELGRAGAAPSARPAFPEMGSHELRLASFCDWPLTAVVRAELLAAAGFFHTGQQDKVRCFFCYGGLQSWEQGDEPWAQHAKWFPRCEFLLRTKGRDFVCSIQETYCHLLGSWMFSDSFQDPWEEPGDTTPSTPSAPVHPGPELPMPRRETRSEGGREPGVRDAEEQLQRLREERTCKVCLDRTVCIVFVPCGHLVCAECAPHLQQCPVCRAPIRSCVRTFLS